MKSRRIRLLILSLSLFTLYAALLATPGWLFAHTVRANNLTLHADQPFDETAGRHVLDLATAKLSASPLYDGRAEFDVYICQSDWRQRLFFNLSYGAGGVALVPVTSNVFIRNSSIEENRVIGHAGSKVPGDRTLDYFIAHEITHVLTWRKTGTIRYFLMPVWVRERYADRVGKGKPLDFNSSHA